MNFTDFLVEIGEYEVTEQHRRSMDFIDFTTMIRPLTQRYRRWVDENFLVGMQIERAGDEPLTISYSDRRNGNRIPATQFKGIIESITDYIISPLRPEPLVENNQLPQVVDPLEGDASQNVPCNIVLRISEGSYEGYPKQEEVTDKSIWNKSPEMEIFDSLYMDQGSRDFFYENYGNFVFIFTPKFNAEEVRGNYFARDELQQWITNPDNIVAKCENDHYFEYYRVGVPTSTLFIRLVVATVPYYVPYSDLENFCNDSLESYVLKETDSFLTNIVSLSVMRHGSMVSAQHCKDDIRKPVYRLVPFTIER